MFTKRPWQLISQDPLTGVQKQEPGTEPETVSKQGCGLEVIAKEDTELCDDRRSRRDRHR